MSPLEERGQRGTAAARATGFDHVRMQAPSRSPPSIDSAASIEAADTPSRAKEPAGPLSMKAREASAARAAPMSPRLQAAADRRCCLLLPPPSQRRVDAWDWKSRRAASNQGARARLNVRRRAARIRFGVRQVRGESQERRFRLQEERSSCSLARIFTASNWHAQACSSGRRRARARRLRVGSAQPTALDLAESSRS